MTEKDKTPNLEPQVPIVSDETLEKLLDPEGFTKKLGNSFSAAVFLVVSLAHDLKLARAAKP